MRLSSRRPLTSLALALSSAAVSVAQQPGRAAEPSSAALAELSASLTLEQAIERALAQSFVLKVESYNLPMARADVRQSLGEFDPSLELSTSARKSEASALTDPLTGLAPVGPISRSNNFDVNLAGLLPTGTFYSLGVSTINSRGTNNDFVDHYSSFAGLTVTQPLLRDFSPNATLRSLRVARTNQAITEWDFRRRVIDTVTSVIVAYHTLHFQYANQAIARRARELAAQTYAASEKRFAVGMSSEYDMLQSRASTASRDEAILNAERGVRAAENALKQLLSNDASPVLLFESITLAPPEPLIPVEVDPVADYPLALQNRPDYQQAVLALQRSELDYRFQRNQVLPSVDLVASYGYSGEGRDFSESRRQMRDREYPSYSAGVVVSVPLTMTGSRARLHRARLALEKQETALRRLEQEIVIALGNAADDVETTWRRVLATRNARELSEQALQAEEKKLTAGSGRTFDLLQRQERLTIDQLAEARAELDYRRVLANYDRVTGRTLERNHVTITTSER